MESITSSCTLGFDSQRNIQSVYRSNPSCQFCLWSFAVTTSGFMLNKLIVHLYITWGEHNTTGAISCHRYVFLYSCSDKKRVSAERNCIKVFFSIWCLWQRWCHQTFYKYGHVLPSLRLAYICSIRTSTYPVCITASKGSWEWRGKNVKGNKTPALRRLLHADVGNACSRAHTLFTPTCQNNVLCFCEKNQNLWSIITIYS